MPFTLVNDLSYEKFVYQNSCRLCWIPINIGEVKIEPSANNDLFEKVLDCLGINLYDNMIPNKVCDECVLKLESFYEYKTSCIRANEKLLAIIEIHENNLEISDSGTAVDEEGNPDALQKDLNFISTEPLDYAFLNLKKEKGHKVKIKKEKNITKKSKTYTSKRTPSYCNICHTDFQTKDKLWQHSAEAHGIEDNGATFKCFGCERKFTSRKARLGHETHFCRGLKSGYKCNICDKYLQSRGIYEKHVLKHKLTNTNSMNETIDFKCRHCDKSFDTKSLLDDHKAKEHAVKRDYICEHCGRIFNRQDYLRKHRMIHGNIKDYHCEECGYVTRQKASLTVHIRKHTGERPYSCDLCELRCVSASNLAAHRKRHLGVKDFECTICSKKFGYKASLEDHMVSIHGEGEPSQKYFCELCSAIFPRQRGLNRHIKNKHKILDKVVEFQESDKQESAMISV